MKFESVPVPQVAKLKVGLGPGLTTPHYRLQGFVVPLAQGGFVLSYFAYDADSGALRLQEHRSFHVQDADADHSAQTAEAKAFFDQRLAPASPAEGSAPG